MPPWCARAASPPRRGAALVVQAATVVCLFAALLRVSGVETGYPMPILLAYLPYAGALALAATHGVELPIAQEVAEILFNGKSPRRVVTDLMERTLKAEQWR